MDTGVGQLRGFGHVALVTADFERLSAFYADVFGAETPERSETDRRLGLGFILVGGAAIHAFERRDEPPGGTDLAAGMTPFARGRIDHVSLEAADLEAFVTVRERLIERGVTDGTPVDFGPLVSLFFQDPDGFGLELSVTKTADWTPPFEVRPPGPRGAR